MSETKMSFPADHPAIRYMGRIDSADPKAPVWIYPATMMTFRFTGTGMTVDLTDRHGYYRPFLGVVIDGVMRRIELQPGMRQTVAAAQGLAPGVHEAMVFKAMDACHHLVIHGIGLDAGAELLCAQELPERKLLVFGDSVSAGEVSELTDHCAMPDPPHEGQYSNAWWSYSWLAARALKAQLHDIAQGGIALMPGSGYFNGPDYLGMEQMYDKLQYNTNIEPMKDWDMALYVPHVIILAIGQNDNHPDNFMDTDIESAKAAQWRSRYAAFVRRLRSLYPNAVIVLTTTILNHHENWDLSIDRVCRELADAKLYRFRYTNNGCGTPGHIRAPEAEKMASELSGFIRSLGDDIWEDET